MRLDKIPTPDGTPIALRVKPAAERAIRAGHPWLYEAAIRRQSRPGASGDLAVVFDGKGRFLAVGLYDPASSIRVRVLQHGEPAPIGREWFQSRLADAVHLRAPLFGAETNGYRLVHGENDGLPGAVVDRYDQTLVLKLYSSAWVPHLRDLVAALEDATRFERLVLRLGRAASERPALLHGLEDGDLLLGPPLKGPLVFRENDLLFEVDPANGQKTGFFLDQRENRARVGRLARGREVLNVFAYTGGFSVYAARGGATSIVSTDISEPALASARRNMAINGESRATEHTTIAGDAFEVMADLARARRRFDLIVVDPPTFASRRSEIAGALRAYASLTRLALEILQPGGILVSASCSSRVRAEDFFTTTQQAARDAGRRLQEMERTGHAPDHPIGFPQGAYLKCLFAIAL